MTVIDEGGLTGKDTIVVRVENVPNTNREVYFSNLRWKCFWECVATVGDIYDYIPAGSYFKVFVLRDNSTGWEELFPFSAGSNDMCWSLDKTTGQLDIGEVTGLAHDTPDVKIMY